VAKVVVLGGMGSVGRALVTVLAKDNDVFIQDKKLSETHNITRCILHVSIPYSDVFVREVIDSIMYFQPIVTILHSTIPVGTTRSIREKDIFHAPVRGQHSDLEGGLRKFKMPVAGFGDHGAVLSHLTNSGIPCELWTSPEETELAKLLCLSRYANTLAWYENADKICKKFGVDRSIVQKWTNSYNDGYFGTPYQRENLIFPNGKVGGTCVLPVTKMLQAQTGDEFTLRNIKLFEGNADGRNLQD
jgi:hypothetical protein